MTDGAASQPVAIRQFMGSVSCPRTLRHADGEDWDQTTDLLVRGRLLCPLSHGRPTDLALLPDQNRCHTCNSPTTAI